MLFNIAIQVILQLFVEFRLDPDAGKEGPSVTDNSVDYRRSERKPFPFGLLRRLNGSR
jgi:hypothetical protein